MLVDQHVKPAVRWGLNQALPRQVMRMSARKGDLQGRIIAEAGGADDALVADLADQVRAAGRLHRGRFAFITASHAVVKEVLTSNDFRTGIDVGADGVLSRLEDIEQMARFEAVDLGGDARAELVTGSRVLQVFDADRAGMGGLIVVLALGLLAMLGVRAPHRRATSRSVD